MLTLNMIRAKSPCRDGWAKLLKHLGKTDGDDEPLPLAIVLASNGLDDALWCLQALPSKWDGPMRLLACDFAEMELPFVTHGEDRPRLAIESARGFAAGTVTEEEMATAGEVARAAMWEVKITWSAWASVWATTRKPARAVREAARASVFAKSKPIRPSRGIKVNAASKPN